MKQASFCFLLFLSIALFGSGCRYEVNGKSPADYSADELRRWQLENIQSRIYGAFAQSQISKSPQDLLKLKDELAKLAQQHANPLIRYWQGYLHYYLAIFYLTVENRAASEDAVMQGIKILESIEQKNSEDYALLALLQGFSMQFRSVIGAAVLSGKIESNINKAIQLDGQNLRAYYAAGSNDFYTPERYGGGKKVELYLKKAIQLPDQKVPNNTLPSWGKEESYEVLIRFYIRREDWTNAKKYFKEAIAKYPQSYLIGQLATQLVDK